MVVAAPHPAYLIKGDDPSLVDQALDTLIGELTKEAGSQQLIEEIPSESGIGAVLDVCQTPAFLSDRRIVLVKGAGRFSASEVVPLVDYLASPMPTTTLVLVGGGGAIPTRLGKAIKDHGHLIDASTPQGKGRVAWVNDRVKKGPVRLEPAALTLLVDHLGDELGTLDGILDALAAAHGEGATVGADELVPYLGVGGAATPWDLTDAIDAGDVETALSQLHRMLGAGGRHPLVIMATLSRHVGNLLKLDGADITSEAQAAQLLGVAPYPAKKAMLQARKMGSTAISRAVQLVAQADIDLRGASAWPSELVLDVLVARLAKLVPGVRKQPRPSGRRAS